MLLENNAIYKYFEIMSKKLIVNESNNSISINKKIK